MFLKGQKVVCVNGDFPLAAAKLYQTLPQKGAVYTVRSVYPARGNYTSLDPAQAEIGVLLEEVRNAPDPFIRKGLPAVELGFNAERFAPLQTLPPKEDVSEGVKDDETWEEYERRKYGPKETIGA